MPDFLERERYELAEGPAYRFSLDRRDFFGVLGGGILVILTCQAQESGSARNRREGRGVPQDLGAWLHIGEDGAVAVYTGKVEVGQNTRTALTQAVSEELRTPVESVRLVMGDTDLVPFDMGTFGSRSTPTMAPQLRRAAAAARGMLLDLAAETWTVERGTLSIADGKVRNPANGASLSFGELTHGRKLARTIEDDASVATPAGNSVPKVDGRAFVTGQHRYSPDVKRPGMLFGRVLRPPSFEAELVSAEGPARMVREGNFVGVTAADPSSAERDVAAIRAEWCPRAQISGQDLFAHLKKTAAAPENEDTSGSIQSGMAAADKKLNQTYTVAYIAHAPLEPRAAVAEWNDGKLTVWTGTQRPFGVRGELASAFGISEERVRVIVPDTGSGYGGKHTGEAAIEAARLAKAAGKPVKLVWTREEEFTWAYFRPAGVIEIASGVRNDGAITAWEFHNYNSGGSGIRPVYDIPNQRIAFHESQSPLRQGSYRALAATANHFAREVHIDELAHAVAMDPLEFRLKNVQDPHFRGVLEAAAERFGWGKKKGGIAAGFEKNGYVATCAEVAVENGQVRIVRVVEAFDCGAVVNPDHLKNQIEGAISMGIGGALFEHIQFEDGKILNARFSRYRVPRFNDMPEIEVVLVDRKDRPSAGAGETPIVGLAPAVSNAVFEVAGVRLRSLPMAPKGIKAS
jgi:nicotinate dehydrogenase subunit B